jgi:hypothetical protein
MKELVDFLPTIRLFLDNLLLRNGRGTSMGFLYGVVIYGLMRLFNPLLQKIESVDFEKLNPVYTIAGGILFMNLPFFTKKPSFPPEVETAINAIKEAEAKGLSEWQVKQLYLKLAQTTVQNANQQNQQPTNPIAEAANTLGQNLPL